MRKPGRIEPVPEAPARARPPDIEPPLEDERAAHILGLQRSVGNRAVSGLMQRDPRRRSQPAPRGRGEAGRPTATKKIEVDSFGTQIIRGPAGKGHKLDMAPGAPIKILKGDTAKLWVTFTGPAKDGGHGGLELLISGEDAGTVVTKGWKDDRTYEWSITFNSVGKRRVQTGAGDPPQRESQEFNVVAEGDEEIPTQPMLEQQATVWIEQVWGAVNQGLADFEKNSQVADWHALAMSVFGNLIWATAAFATGGGAFLVSVGGIAVGSAPAIAAVSSKDDFHKVARSESDELAKQLKARVPKVVDEAHGEAMAQRRGGRETYHKLIERLLQPDFIDTGAIASVNSARIAALTERQLFLRSGSSPSEDWAGWKKGDWWLEYQYRVDGAMGGYGKAAPMDEWRLSRESEDATLYPIDPAVRNARDRLNELQASLGGPHRVRDWPVRKRVKLYVRGSYALTVELDGANRAKGLGAEYLDRRQVEALVEAAGWDWSGNGLLRYVWGGSGLPADINKIR
jgi:hypothetical protein